MLFQANPDRPHRPLATSETFMNPIPLRVLIADGNAYVRDGFTTLIDRQVDMSVVAQAVNGQEAIDLFRRHLPDVTLMDIQMPILDGIAALTRIRAEFASADR